MINSNGSSSSEGGGSDSGDRELDVAWRGAPTHPFHPAQKIFAHRLGWEACYAIGAVKSLVRAGPR